MPIHLITATHLKNWRGREPQGDLPTLIRDLVWTTAARLKHIPFPGGDSVYRPGFDGVVIADDDSVYVPEGRSIWEIGTDKGPKKKAESDYKKRADESDLNTIFVFVTSLEFRDKEAWCEEKRQELKWKDVRVYDADDLENWLSVAPSVSFLWAERVANVPADKVMPALELMDEWLMAMGNLFSPKVVCAGRERGASSHAFLDWLELEEPSLLRLKSYSHTDGKMFVAAVLSHMDGYGDWLVRCLMTDNKSALRQLVASITPQLIVTSVDDAGLARKAIANGHKYCILTSRSASNFPDQDTVIEIPLRLASYEVENELVQLGMPRPQADVLLRKTGRMLMALRREVAGEHPCWAEPGIRDVMSTVVLVSGWNESLNEDREALESLSGQKYSEVEKTLKKVKLTPESPIQYVEPFWKLLSPMDAWRCLGPQLSKNDFDRFREVVFSAFTAPDPVMELPPDKRWAAAIYEKRTPYSGFIRKGLLQSLIIIAEFGEVFLLEGLDHPQAWITRLVADIFEACREEPKWEGLASSLKELAEAAPTAFLDELERRLSDDKTSLVSFLESKGDAMFTPNLHVPLVWGLERIAWFPEHLSRVANIQIQLHELDPGGNMNPRPIGSLGGIFSPAHPQTMAPWEEQQEVLNSLAGHYPDSTFKLLLALIPKYGNLIDHSNKPDWREITSTQAQYWHEVYERSAWYEEKLIEMAGYDGSRWAKLIEVFQWLQPDSQKEIIQVLNKLSDSSELQQCEVLRDQIRRTVHSQRSYSSEKVDLSDMDSLEVIFNQLTPSDVFKKNVWLFESWPATLAGRRNQSHEEKDKKLKELRENALSEIIAKFGIEGVFELSRTVENPYVVGSSFGHYMIQDQWVEFCRLMDFEDNVIAEFCKSCVHATSRFGEDWVREEIERGMSENIHPHFIASLCRVLPNTKDTWELVAGAGKEADKEFWRNVYHYRLFEDERSFEDKVYAFDKIFEFGNPATWFDIISSKKNILSYEQVERVLKAYLVNQDERVQQYEIMQAFEILRSFPERNEQEIIYLEWAYYKAFEPNSPRLVIHEKMASDVNFFNEMIQLLTGEHQAITSKSPNNAWGIFRSWATIPGTKSDGTIDQESLEHWVTQVRDDYFESEHKDLVDTIIGEVFAHSPEDSEGRFPCKEVCDSFEKHMTSKMENGFRVGVHNKRGVHSRSPYEGGSQERGLAAKYGNWANMCRHKWPKVASVLGAIKEEYEREGKWHDRKKLHDEMYYG